ncbi:hypothetical protein VP01_13009g1, partial [Puccinia sorghi]
GSCQNRRESHGCPKHQKAIEKVAKLPFTSLQERKTKKYKKEFLIPKSYLLSNNQIFEEEEGTWFLRKKNSSNVSQYDEKIEDNQEEALECEA